jgi:hypothetical protein
MLEYQRKPLAKTTCTLFLTNLFAHRSSLTICIAKYRTTQSPIFFIFHRLKNLKFKPRADLVCSRSSYKLDNFYLYAAIQSTHLSMTFISLDLLLPVLLTLKKSLLSRQSGLFYSILLGHSLITTACLCFIMICTAPFRI